ncbi:riboflavin biosynthesis protein RibF [Chitinispirillales bacterium ANBcel5]|uniref:riboflavin biosynthesis protein RibF n=1 Tax=Cellulosispirillum alkaliphilum TaxID=3039283 RepID=UPI002A51B926|nr:riboflavin biosynthesis protein RibF [Chitinispirillales bacterium ANBcel5]
MKLLRLDDNFTSLPQSIVTVGNFDGVHRGHALLLSEVVKRAREANVCSVAVTFDPHTRSVVFPELSQMTLTTLEEKAALIEGFGIDYLVVIPFDNEFRQLSATQFAEQILIKKLNALGWVMGEGHSVGKNHSGGKNFLHQVMSKYHINTFVVSLYKQDETVISSTQIRKLIIEGKIQKAVEGLSHPYLITVSRVEGTKTGTKLGYPTLNFRKPSSQKVIPPAGVYAAELEFKDRKVQGALYFGNCPTFSNRDIHFEFHVFEFGVDEPHYGEHCNLWLHRFIRSDISFSQESQLSEQITKDINEIREYFSQETHSWS